jgi:hypothetical protein
VGYSEGWAVVTERVTARLVRQRVLVAINLLGCHAQIILARHVVAVEH